LREDEKKVILEKTLFPSLSALLETPIHTGQGYYVLTGRGPRSLGTIRPKAVLEVIYGIHEGRNPEYRLVFVDGDSVERNLPITDLSWRYYLDYMRGQGLRPNRVASDLLMVLRSVEVFLRIGLARGWEKFPDRCYIQIVGIHTFPDFLKGRTFADFAPDRPTTTVDENP
jgi:hypothetical protein